MSGAAGDGPDRARADALFDAALDLPAGQRADFVRSSCGGDENLAALVLRLLAAVDEDDDRLVTGGAHVGAFAATLARDADSAAALLGETVGRYRVVEELGRGGMAVVYRAERVDGEVEQQVALKVLQSGIPSEEMLRRFRLERQILAQVRHPGIAQLLDAGSTAAGAPYLVMELVEGVPIDRWCTEQALSVDQRLQVFLQVTRAVAFAHRNLIVHRDIKPSNILVTAEGDVKLLDFGIAKLVEDDAEATATMLRAMTPAFASPEQVEGGPVTTATDVYQLGVLLYLLLTGRGPYREDTGDGMALLQAIRTTEPLKPSSVVLEARLRRELSGDLDTILAAALRKQPDRRYASVDAFAADVEAFLAGLPVRARPESVAYRLRKMIGRHRAASSLGAAAILALIAVVSIYTNRLQDERDLARLEAEKATGIADFLRGLFELSAPERARGAEITARDLLERGAERISVELATQPVRRAMLETTIGEVYGELALYEDAQELLERAVATRREHPGKDRLDLAQSLFTLGHLCERALDLETGRAALTECLELRTAALGAHAPETALARGWLGLIAYRDIRYEEAKALLETALPDLVAGFGEMSREVGNACNHLALVYQELRENAAAHEYYERAIRILDAVSAAGSPLPAAVRVNYSSMVRRAGDMERADRLLVEALPILVRIYGADHPNIGVVLTNRANLHRDWGRYESAEQLQREALDNWTRALGPDHLQISWCWNNLGLIRRELHDEEGAREEFALAVTHVERTLGRDHPEIMIPLRNLAGSELALGRPAEALALYEETVALYQTTYGPGHSLLFRSYLGVADCHDALARPALAADWFEKAAAVGRRDENHAIAEAVKPLLDAARCRLAAGEESAARALLEEAAAAGGEAGAAQVAEARSRLGF